MIVTDHSALEGKVFLRTPQEEAVFGLPLPKDPLKPARTGLHKGQGFETPFLLCPWSPVICSAPTLESSFSYGQLLGKGVGGRDRSFLKELGKGSQNTTNLPNSSAGCSAPNNQPSLCHSHSRCPSLNSLGLSQLSPGLSYRQPPLQQNCCKTIVNTGTDIHLKIKYVMGNQSEIHLCPT